MVMMMMMMVMVKMVMVVTVMVMMMAMVMVMVMMMMAMVLMMMMMTTAMMMMMMMMMMPEPAQSKCGYEDFQERWWTLIPRHPSCVSLRGRNAHGHSTKTILYGNLQEKRPRTPLGTSFCDGQSTRAI